MKKIALFFLGMALMPSCAFAVDGVVLINQSTVMAAGGFPYVIAQSGSYKLSGNLVLSNANANGISITANNVTLDLNGFSITGPAVCNLGTCTVNGININGTITYYGIYANNFNISVMNGTVAGMTAGGITLPSGAYIEKVHASSNGGYGINVFEGIVINSTATNNGYGGLQGTNSTLTGNTAARNGWVGIFGAESTISGNTSNGNGHYGFIADCPSVVVNNTAVSNGTLNLTTDAGSVCVMVNNTAP